MPKALCGSHPLLLFREHDSCESQKDLLHFYLAVLPQSIHLHIYLPNHRSHFNTTCSALQPADALTGV